MSSTAVNSVAAGIAAVGTVNIPEWNDESEFSNRETRSSGLYIVPSKNVLSRPSDITGFVLTAVNSNGKVAWKPTTSSPIVNISLNNLTDVSLTAEVNGQFLIYQAGSDIWTNKSLTGDVTVSASGVTALKTSGATPGTYTNSTVTVDAKGIVTSISSGVTVPGALDDLTDVTLTNQTNNQVLIFDQTLGDWINKTLSGDITISGLGVTKLADTVVVPGTYTLANIEVNSQGRITSATNGTIPLIPIQNLSNVTVTSPVQGNILAYQTSGDWINVSVNGDATVSQSGNLILTNSGVTSGTYSYPTVTVDPKGRITGISTNVLTLSSLNNVSISNISGGNVLIYDNTANKWINRVIGGDINITSSGITTLSPTGVAPGSYQLATLTINSQGRITNAINGDASIGNLKDVTITGPLNGQVLIYNNLEWSNRTLSGDISIAPTGVAILSNTGVTSGTYPFANVTVSSTGRLTSASTSQLLSGRILIGNGSNIPAPVIVTGDMTLSSTGVATLTNTTVIPGSYTFANITVDSKGRITEASTSQLLSGRILIGNGSNIPAPVIVTGDMTLSSTGVSTLTNTTVIPGTYPFANVTVDAKGRLTSALISQLESGKILIGNDLGVVSGEYLKGDATLASDGRLTLSDTGVTPGSYSFANVTVDTKGRLTSVNVSSLESGKILIGDGSGVASAVAVTGDMTLASTGVATLSNTGVISGVYNLPRITVDTKGRITNVSPVTLSPGSLLVGNSSSQATPTTVSGDMTLSDTGVVTLSDTGVNAGTYSFATVTTDSKGRLIGASNGTLASGKILIGNATNDASPVTVTGDINIAPTGVATLSNTGVSSGTYSFANVTVDSKGRITDASTSQLESGKILIGDGSGVASAVAVTGDITIAPTGVATLSNTGVSAGSYSFATVTTDSKGRLTSASSSNCPNGDILIGDVNNKVSNVTVSGDITIAPTGVATLSDTGVSVGTYSFATVTVDSKGRITSASNGTLASGKILIGNGSNIPTPVTVTGDMTLSASGVATLSNTGVSAGSYKCSNITVDGKGRITSAVSGGLDDLKNVNLTGPLDGQVLAFDLASGEWINVDPPSGSPGGSNGSVQFNNNGTFAGTGSLIWTTGTNTLTTVNMSFSGKLKVGAGTYYMTSVANSGVYLSASSTTPASNDTLIADKMVTSNDIVVRSSLRVGDTTSFYLKGNSNGINVATSSSTIQTNPTILGTTSLTSNNIIGRTYLGINTSANSNYILGDASGFRVSANSSTISDTDTAINNQGVTCNRLTVYSETNADDGLYIRDVRTDNEYVRIYNDNNLNFQMYANESSYCKYTLSYNEASITASTTSSDTGAYMRELSNNNVQFGCNNGSGSTIITASTSNSICSFEYNSATDRRVLPVSSSSTNKVFLGESTNRWDTIYSINNLNVSSDVRFKNVLDDQSSLDMLLEHWGKYYKTTLYKLKNDSSDKIQIGIIAQQIIKVFEDAGLDFRNYNVISVDDQGYYGANYDAIALIELAYQRHLSDLQEIRIKRIEEKLGLM